MISKHLQPQVDAALAPMLSMGEQTKHAGTAWKAERTGILPTGLVPRQRVVAVLTDQRLIVLARNKGRGQSGLSWEWSAKFEDISLVHVFYFNPLLSITVATSKRKFALEFPFGQRRTGRLFLRQLKNPTELPAANEWTDDFSRG